jgi:hypothetical protein
MRTEMPMRWIEQAESRRVLMHLLPERMPMPPRSGVTADAVWHLPARLLCWLAARHPLGWSISLPRPH